MILKISDQLYQLPSQNIFSKTKNNSVLQKKKKGFELTKQKSQNKTLIL